MKRKITAFPAVQPFSFILSLYSSFLKNFIRKFYDVKILQQIVSPDKCGISPETDARIPLFQKNVCHSLTMYSGAR